MSANRKCGRPTGRSHTGQKLPFARRLPEAFPSLIDRGYLSRSLGILGSLRQTRHLVACPHRSVYQFSISVDTVPCLTVAQRVLRLFCTPKSRYLDKFDGPEARGKEAAPTWRLLMRTTMCERSEP